MSLPLHMCAKLAARDLTRTVGDATLVDQVSLEVDAGDALALVGPSGAGKSSLLRLLCRLDEPTGGTVLLDGRDYRNMSPRALRRRVAFVAQQPALLAGTVQENVTLGPRLRGETPDGTRVQEVLATLGLKDAMDQNVDELSGGEQQRVALARAVANGPEVLLLDEPTASLDRETRERVHDLLESLTRIAVVVVTHAPEEARRLANRAVEMRAGRVVRTGPSGEVAE